MFGKSEEGIDKKLARNIKRIRMERGMTQKDLADAMGSIEQSVSKFERAISAPSAKAIMQLCEALQVTPNDLYLNDADWRSWQSEKLEHQDHSVNGLVDHVEMVQKMFAEAELARKAGDEKLERATLDQIIQIYMWTNDHFREVAHLLDRRYMNEYLDKMEKETRNAMINNAEL
ncbi:MAG: helix-turn-helix domain-containing protein [Lactobacillus sp.]|jgi:transcriptional regulator with XRE-family HTH domain|nr:helix-turn-helix domain-containing protein [Lactobacillus sp.]MCI2032683.1 helix-turn-helix domain-containing protein [Lactobacillus sp.]